MKVEYGTLRKFTNMDVINHFGKVKLSKKIKIIGAYAFQNCTSLTKIVIPEGVTKISDRAFQDCTSLTEIVIPSSVTEIGYCAFFNCTSLTKIMIPNSVTEIYDEAFFNCTSLTEIVIPSSVTEIGYGAFYNCISLTKIVIPNSVTEIYDEAFRDCTSLTKIEIPESVTKIRAYAFQNCTSLTKIVIPNSVTEIYDETFYNCTSLTKIVIPNSVTEIYDEAFYNCTSLTEIVIPSSVTEIYDGAFCNCTSLTKIVIPSSVTEIYDEVFQNCTSLTEIEIPEGVTKIGYCAFSHCSSLKTLHLSKNLKSLDADSFYKSDNIELMIGTSLFFITHNRGQKSKINCFPHNTTIYGIKCNSTELIPTIQKKELEDKINEYLKNKNIVDKNGDHSKFINHVIESYKGEDYYDYRNDFEKYMEGYIKNLDKKKKKVISNTSIKEESKAVSFNDKEDGSKIKIIDMVDNITPEKNKQRIENQITDNHNILGLSKKHHETLLYEYAKTLGLETWVDKLRARLNISLLCGDIPKIYFDDINHIYFIKEMIQSLSENIDYDYNSAIKEYARYYIESHNSLNKNNIDNKKKVSLDKKPLTLRKK